MSEIKLRLQEDMKSAMRSGDKTRLNTVRLVLAALKQREIDDQIILDDAGVIPLLEKLRKQRQDSIQQFQTAGRPELVDKEAAEIVVIESYLPTQLSVEEITQHVQQTLTEINATSAADMGKVIAAIKPKLQGRADMSVVSRIVKEHLTA